MCRCHQVGGGGKGISDQRAESACASARRWWPPPVQTREVPHVYMLCSLQHLLPSILASVSHLLLSLLLHTRGWEELSAFLVWSLLSFTPPCWSLTPYFLIIHFHAHFSILYVTCFDLSTYVCPCCCPWFRPPPSPPACWQPLSAHLLASGSAP